MNQKNTTNNGTNETNHSRTDVSKKNRKKISFTEGSIISALLRFALPVLGALVLQSAYGAVDLLVVGKFGNESSISAVGTGSVFMQMVTFIITSLAMGSTVIIGQHIGEKKPKAAGNTVGTTVVMFLVLGAILTVLLELFTNNIVSILNVPEEAVTKTATYIRICSGGILVIIAYNVISSVLRGVGNAVLPFVFVLVACISNIVGDLLLIGAFKMDVAGAAIATVFAQLVAVIVSVIVLKNFNLGIEFKLSQIRLDVAEFKKILQVGAPIALQETTVQISFLVINSIVNGMGLMPSAGYGVAQKIVAFIMLVPSSVMQTVSAFVAQNVGAGKTKRAFTGFYKAMLGGTVVGVFMFLLGFFGGGFLSLAFTDKTEVIEQSAAYLRGFSLDCILTCILFSSIGFFNGNGKSTPVMVQGMVSAIFIRIPVSIFMAHLPNTTLAYVGFATPISTIFGIGFFGVCFVLFFHNNHKRGIVLK